MTHVEHANIPTGDAPAPARNSHLLRFGLENFLTFHEKVKSLDATLEKIASVADTDISKKALRLQKQLAKIEPSVTMIGQVKAGKTSLVNAMIGTPGLLPSDVNPWTSVVTSLHINGETPAEGTKAAFRFFDHEEWDRLVQAGGRIGELASRAGADDELEKVKEQVAMMREKTKQRLGKKFELLLGQEHDYGYFDEDLIKRYVCLGDDLDEINPVEDTQGRFADITKSADLFLTLPDIPTSMCIRDTPGVNDTFMMREQITIGAIRDSRICVVVLSASQALSSIDMALIRLISNVKSREVIIFVNRIDELSDPSAQVPEIRDSILATMKAHDGPQDAQIIFGSAHWANMALSDRLDELSEDGAAAVVNWAETALSEGGEILSPSEMIWDLSGVPMLYRALSERMIESTGHETIEKVAKSAFNLANGIRASNQVLSIKRVDNTETKMDKTAFVNELDQMQASTMKQMESEFDAIIADFSARIDQSHKRFLDRATESLIAHLEANGQNTVWQYSPMGLRLLLRSTYQVFSRKSVSSSEKVFNSSAAEIGDIYKKMLNVKIDGFQVQAPSAPRIPPPVALGQTIALDLQGSWWKSWWQKRRGYQAFASNFHDMIAAETQSMVNELKISQANAIRENTMDVLKDFLAEQRTILMSVAEKAEVSPEELKEIFGIRAQEERQAILESALSLLSKYAA